jgi:hypothetical protein
MSKDVSPPNENCGTPTPVVVEEVVLEVLEVVEVDEEVVDVVELVH